MVYLLTEAVNKYQDGNVADFLHECLKGTFYDCLLYTSSTYDSSCNGTWLLMKDIYTTSTFGNNNSYKDSSIHTYPVSYTHLAAPVR